LIAVSVGLLFFGRGRNGDALPIFQKSPWIVGTLFAVAILCLFLCRPHGRRSKPELATLEIETPPPPWSFAG
jgi:hypothetical protein